MVHAGCCGVRGDSARSLVDCGVSLCAIHYTPQNLASKRATWQQQQGTDGLLLRVKRLIVCIASMRFL